MPSREYAFVEDTKITGYLLNLEHPDGRSKASLFLKAGFRLDNIAEYIIEGQVERVDSFRFNLRTVWIITTSSKQPKLITAYPLPL